MTLVRTPKVDTTFDSRILGGYAVFPTAHALRRATRATERLDLAVETLQAVDQYRASLLALMDDSVIALRERGTKWEALKRRTGLPIETLRGRIRSRLERRRCGHADPDRVIAPDRARAA